MRKHGSIILCLAFPVFLQAQGGTSLIGGPTEHDDARRWFLPRANGGDELVLRASGGSGYPDHSFSEPGAPVSSVVMMRFNKAAAATSTSVHERILHAEAIRFLGCDQWYYLNYWSGTAIDSLIAVGMTERDIVIGGISADLVILGNC